MCGRAKVEGYMWCDYAWTIQMARLDPDESWLTPGVVWMGGGGMGTRRGSRWLFPLCIPDFIITILTCYAPQSCFHHFSAAHGRLNCGARGEIEPPLRQVSCDVRSRSCSSKIRVFICRGKGDGVLRTANPRKFICNLIPKRSTLWQCYREPCLHEFVSVGLEHTMYQSRQAYTRLRLFPWFWKDRIPFHS